MEYLLYVTLVEYLAEVFFRPSVMLHCFVLCKRLQGLPNSLILMDSVGRLVMTVMTQLDLQAVMLRGIPASCTEDVMNLKPSCTPTEKAMVRVFLKDALSHYSSPLSSFSYLFLGQVGAVVCLFRLGLSQEPPLVTATSVHPVALREAPLSLSRIYVIILL